MKRNRINLLTIYIIILISGLSTLANAQSYSGQMAGKGAGEGALIGAIAGAVFGDGDDFLGDVAEGALIGGGVGALAGALEGGRMDRQAKQEFDQLVRQFGEDNLRGYVELMQCNYEKSIALFRVAEVSNVSDHKLAGIWLQAIAEKDRKNVEEAKSLYTRIIDNDSDIDDDQQAGIAVDQYVLTLRDDRRANNLPSCNR